MALQGRQDPARRGLLEHPPFALPVLGGRRPALPTWLCLGTLCWPFISFFSCEGKGGNGGRKGAQRINQLRVRTGKNTA